MTTLVVGASGATGQLLVEQMLKRGHSVRAIVRSRDSLPEALRHQEKLSLIQASLLDLSGAEMAKHVDGCDAVASCLGHNPSFRGVYGQPRRLVSEATLRLCRAIKENAPEAPVKVVLMNTAGTSNRDIAEPVSFGEKSVVGLLRILLPPHADNEQAADYLRSEVGQDSPTIQWAVVRPDNLLDESEVTAYELHASPNRSAIFDSGVTSRINVAHFMADLITDQEIWTQWKGQMPVIYNKA